MIEKDLQLFKKYAYTRNKVEEEKRLQFIDKVLQVSKHVTFDKESLILRQDETNDNVYILVSGVCDLVINGEKFVSLKRRGDIVGETSVINQVKNSTVVQAKTEVSMLSLPKSIVLKDPDIGSFLAMGLAQKLDWTLKQSGNINDGKIRFLENEIQIVKQFLQSEQSKINSLQTAYDAVKKADRLKSEILQNMNHELRTPLNGILGFSELISLGASELSRDEIREYSNIIKDSGKSLLSLVNNLIDMASLKSGTADFIFSKNNLYLQAKEVLCQCNDEIMKKKINVNLEKPETDILAIYDEKRIFQVISHLVSNAIKYSPIGGNVTITVIGNGESVVFSIRDHGCGIPVNEVEDIFSGFAQSSRTKDGSGGRALSLAISKSVLESHGGRLWVEQPETGVGALFRFSLDKA